MARTTLSLLLHLRDEAVQAPLPVKVLPEELGGEHADWPVARNHGVEIQLEHFVQGLVHSTALPPPA